MIQASKISRHNYKALLYPNTYLINSADDFLNHIKDFSFKRGIKTKSMGVSKVRPIASD